MTVVAVPRRRGRVTGGAGRRGLILLPVTGFALLLTAAPAAAAGGITSPGSGATITDASPFQVKATGGTCGGILKVTGPGGFSRTDSSTSNGAALAISMDPKQVSNGDYHVVLTTKTKPII